MNNLSLLSLSLSGVYNTPYFAGYRRCSVKKSQFSRFFGLLINDIPNVVLDGSILSNWLGPVLHQEGPTPKVYENQEINDYLSSLDYRLIIRNCQFTYSAQEESNAPILYVLNDVGEVSIQNTIFIECEVIFGEGQIMSILSQTFEMTDVCFHTCETNQSMEVAGYVQAKLITTNFTYFYDCSCNTDISSLLLLSGEKVYTGGINISQCTGLKNGLIVLASEQCLIEYSIAYYCHCGTTMSAFVTDPKNLRNAFINDTLFIHASFTGFPMPYASGRVGFCYFIDCEGVILNPEKSPTNAVLIYENCTFNTNITDVAKFVQLIDCIWDYTASPSCREFHDIGECVVQHCPTPPNGLSAGAIAGIVIGVIIFVGLVILITVLVIKYRRNDDDDDYSSDSYS